MIGNGRVGLGGRFSLRRRVPNKNLREKKMKKKRERIRYIVSIIELYTLEHMS